MKPSIGGAHVSCRCNQFGRKLTSWPAPANRPHGEVINRWIVIDMFTKAITGTPTKNAIAEAVAQIKAIYS